MRRCFPLLMPALVLGTWLGNASATVVVSPQAGCPSSDAIVRQLQHLGALDLLVELGDAAVQVDASALRLRFRDHRGEPLGERTVTAPTDCDARATLAAAVITAFVGDWAQTALAPTSAVGVRSAPRPAAGQPWQSELGVMLAAIHDGDEGGYGLGIRGDLGRGPWLLSALVAGTAERAQPLGAGEGAYRFLRAGVGLGGRTLGPHVFWDATLLPMIERLSLAGKDLAANRTVTSWGFAVVGQTRLGWSGWRLRPFLFLAASYRVPGERMTLENRPGYRVPLSPINVEAGLGISLRIAP